MKTIEVEGVWLRFHRGEISVSVQHEGIWKRVISENVDDETTISHIAEPSGIAKSPKDEAIE